MKPKTSRLKKRKRKSSPDELRLLKEQQKLLYLRHRRKMKQRQLLFQRIRSLIHLGAIIAVFLSIVYIMVQPYWKLNAFIFSNYPNNSLLLEGNLITKDNQVINKLKQLKVADKPVYFVNPSKFEEKLLELDPIKKVYVRRYWLPARLSIILVERQPVFLIHKTVNASPAYSITQDARRIDKEFLPLPEKYEKQVYDIILPGAESKWASETVDKYLRIAKIVEKSTKERLLYMDLSRPNDVYLKMSGCLIRLGEIDATVFERINRLKPIMHEVKKLENKIEYIDLRWDKGLFLKEKSEKKLTEVKVKEEEPVDPKKLEEQKKQDAVKAQTIADTMNNMTLSGNNAQNLTESTVTAVNETQSASVSQDSQEQSQRPPRQQSQTKPVQNQSQPKPAQNQSSVTEQH